MSVCEKVNGLKFKLVEYREICGLKFKLTSFPFCERRY